MGTPEWTIYCHLHVESGRRYIGLTKKTILQRWNSHLVNAKAKRGKGCHHFWNAIRKYGKDAFEGRVIEVWDTIEKANEREDYWIEFYDTRNPEKGFNLAKGGQHVPHPIRKNPWDDPEYRARCASTIRRRMGTQEARALCSKASKEVHLRPEVREKLSSASNRMWADREYREKQSGWVHSPEFADLCLTGFKRGAELNREKTHCVHGHELSGDNLKVKDGSRICLICKRNRTRKWKKNLSPEMAESKRAQDRNYMRRRRADEGARIGSL